MKSSPKICRVCLSQEGVFLDLFASKSQTVSYAEDLNKCLCCEVKEGDGLSSKICVKCVGLLSDCRPFVDEVFEKGPEKISSEDCCHYCHSSNNYLFPTPEASVVKTKDCFNINVSPKTKICHRCQFHLDVLHDLKTKACAALKQFYSNSISPEKKKSVKDLESVEDLVHRLKNKFNMNKSAVNPPDVAQEIQVKVIDIQLAIGKDFFSTGTVSVKEVLSALKASSSEKLTSPLISTDNSYSKRKNKPGPSSSKQNGKSSLKNIDSVNHNKLKHEDKAKEHLATKSQDTSSSDKKNDCQSPKKQKLTKDSSGKSVKDSTLKATKHSSEESSKKSTVSSSSSETNFRESSDAAKRKRTHSTEGKSPAEMARLQLEELEKYNKKSRKRLASSSDDSDVIRSVRKRAEPKSRLKDTVKDSLKGTSASEGVSDSLTSPGGSKGKVEVPAGLDKENMGPKKRRRSTSKRNNSQYLEKEEVDDEPGSEKEKINTGNSDDEDEERRGKKRKRIVNSDSDRDSSSELKNAVKGSSQAFEGQPDFLKELDELLKLTPKNMFRPFICSVCHEGYVSTVKGKLHKLVVHDPHSNMELKLQRCDINLSKNSFLRSFANETHDEKTNNKDVPKDEEKADQKKISEDSDSDFEMQMKGERPSNDAFDELFSSSDHKDSPKELEGRCAEKSTCPNELESSNAEELSCPKELESTTVEDSSCPKELESTTAEKLTGLEENEDSCAEKLTCPKEPVSSSAEKSIGNVPDTINNDHGEEQSKPKGASDIEINEEEKDEVIEKEKSDNEDGEGAGNAERVKDKCEVSQDDVHNSEIISKEEGDARKKEDELNAEPADTKTSEEEDIVPSQNDKANPEAIKNNTGDEKNYPPKEVDEEEKKNECSQSDSQDKEISKDDITGQVEGGEEVETHVSEGAVDGNKREDDEVTNEDESTSRSNHNLEGENENANGIHEFLDINSVEGLESVSSEEENYDESPDVSHSQEEVKDNVQDKGSLANKNPSDDGLHGLT